MRKFATYINTILLDENKIWFIAESTNELFYYDINEDKTFFFCLITHEDYGKPFLYSKIIKYKDSLVLIPQEAKAIYRVQIDTRLVDKIAIDEELLKEIPENHAKFTTACVVHGKLYVVGAACPFILEIDLSTNDTKVVYSNEIFGNKGREAIYVRKMIQIGDDFIVPLAYKNSVCIFNTISGTVKETININSCVAGFTSICECEGKICLASRKTDEIIICNEFFDVLKTIHAYNKNENKTSISECIAWDNSIYIFPYEKGTIKRINLSSDAFEMSDEFDKEFEKVYAIGYNDETLCFADNPNGIIVLTDGNINDIAIRVPITEQYRNRRINKLKNQKENEQIFNESDQIDLEDFLLMLQQG